MEIKHGDVDKIYNCRHYFGDEKVTEALLKAKFLPEMTISLASAVINKPLKISDATS